MNTKEIPAPKQFPPDFTIPQCILDLGLDDQSWHNDACPSFLMYERGDAMKGDYEYVSLWVDHVEPAQRDFPEFPRYRICVEAHEGGYCLLDTDSLEEVMARIKAMKESLELINQNKVKAIESCDKSWAVVEGMSAGYASGTSLARKFCRN